MRRPRTSRLGRVSLVRDLSAVCPRTGETGGHRTTPDDTKRRRKLPLNRPNATSWPRRREPSTRSSSPPSDTGSCAKALVRGLREYWAPVSHDVLSRIGPAYEGCGACRSGYSDTSFPVCPCSGLTSPTSHAARRGRRWTADRRTRRQFKGSPVLRRCAGERADGIDGEGHRVDVGDGLHGAGRLTRWGEGRGRRR